MNPPTRKHVTSHQVETEAPPKKRTKQGNQKVESIQRMVATILVLTDYDNTAINRVWMNPENANTFKPLNNRTKFKYLQIGSRVYQIQPCSSIDAYTIGLNNLQWIEAYNQDLTFSSLNKENNVVLKSFVKPFDKINYLRKVVFNLTLNKDLETIKKNPKILPLQDLQNEFKKYFVSSFIGSKQTSNICSVMGNFQATVKSMIFKNKTNKEYKEPFGYVDEATEFDFNILNDSELAVVDHVCSDLSPAFYCSATIVHYNSSDYKLSPLLLNMNKIKKILREKVKDKIFIISHKFRINYSPELYLQVQFKKITSTDQFCPTRRMDYHTAFAFTGNEKIRFEPNADTIFSKGPVAEAQQVILQSVAHTLKKDSAVKYYETFSWVSLERFKNVLLRHPEGFKTDQTFSIDTSSGSLKVKINQVVPVNTEKRQITKLTRWNLEKNCDLKIHLKEAHKLVLVDNDTRHFLNSVTIEIHTESSQKTTITQSVLESIVRRQIPKVIFKDQEFKIGLKDLPEVVLKIKDLDYQDLDKKDIKHQALGKIKGDTKINFLIESQQITVVQDDSGIMAVDPIRQLEELGVGGLSEDAAKNIRKIILHRGPLKKDIEDRGIKTVKGVVLYGPPGTGKTILAKAISKILGYETNMITATEILNKYVGESEKNIRELFQPALDEPTKDFVLIIDEFEAIVGNRFQGGENNRFRDELANQVLGCMDGPKEIKNLIVIGMTNDLTAIDPAILRHGRFGTHIKMDLPNMEGRKKILEIHTKKLREKNLLKEIDWNYLIEKTDKYSGAQLESIVEKAATIAIERGGPNESVLHKDFVEALNLMNLKEDHTKTYSTLYN